MNKQRPDIVSRKLLSTRYGDAPVAYLCGSVVRGEETEFSDIDLIVVYKRVDAARRESFTYSSWNVEAFIHDPETLEYFMTKVDAPSGIPSMANMVSEGVLLTDEGSLSRSVERLARDVLEKGPAPWSEDDILKSRYIITDLVDDIRAPRSQDELIGTVTRLYPLVADHFLRTNQQWSAKGKSIQRQLGKIDHEYATLFAVAFRNALKTGETSELITLCDKTLAPAGGWLFEEYTQIAPRDWRITKNG